MATNVPSFEKQAPGLDASTWSDVLKQQIGSSSRTQREAARAGIGSDGTTQDRFDTSGTRYSGWKESPYAPSDLTSFDDQTQALFGNRLGQYSSGGKQNFGYYGDVDVYNPEEAGTYLAGRGWNLAKGPEDTDYQKAGLDLLDYGFGSGPRQAVYQQGRQDFTQKSGVDEYLKTLGYSDQGSELNIRHNLPELPGLNDIFMKLKNSVYGKKTPEEYLNSIGFDTNLGTNLGISAINPGSLKGFNDNFLTLNDTYYGRDNQVDYLTGQGYKDIGGAPNMSVNDTGLASEYIKNLVQYGDKYFNPMTEGEFLGSKGYQLAGNQSVDATIQALFGDKFSKADDQLYYSGLDDYSKAQWGTAGYNTADLGGGKYNILGSGGNTIGTGYKSLDDTIREMSRGGSYENFLESNPITAADTGEWSGLPEGYMGYNWVDPRTPVDYDSEGNRVSGGATNYRTRAEAEAAARAYYDSPINQQQAHYKTPGDISDLQRWEQIGNLQQGNPFTPITAGNWRSLGGDSDTETIKGLDTLYGSNPLLLGDKLLGYGQDMTPAEAGDWGYQNPNYLAVEDLKGTSTSGAYMGRQMLDQNKWNQLVQGTGNGNIFVTPENAAQLPGFQNTYSEFRQKPDNGVFGQNGLGKVLTPIAQALSFFPPTAPYAQAYLAASALKHNDPLGAAMNAYGSYTGFGGEGFATPDFMKGMSAPAQAAITQGAKGALQTAFQGGGLGDIFKSGATGAAGGYAGSSLGDYFGKAAGGKDSPILSQGAKNFGSSLGSGTVKGLASGNADVGNILKTAGMAGLSGASSKAIGTGLQDMFDKADLSKKDAEDIGQTISSYGVGKYQQNEKEKARKKQLAKVVKKQTPPRKV